MSAIRAVPRSPSAARAQAVRPAARRAALAGWLSAVLLGALIVARLGLGAAFALLQPPLESHDETGHSAYVAYVAAHRALPPPGGPNPFDEGHQPPLYYVVPGLIGNAFGIEGEYTPPLNPFFLSADGSRGVNAAVHIPAREEPPWHGGLLLLYLARFWSVLLGGAMVALTWAIGRLALPRRPGIALAGAAIAAFVPTSLAVTDAVTNDALTPVTFGLALLAALCFVRRPNALGAGALGTAIGLALLTKNSALVLPAFALLVVAVAWRRHGGHPTIPWRRVAGWLTALYGSLLIVAGWWYLRNRLLYGHWITDRKEAATLINAPGVQGKALVHSASGSFVGQLLDYTFRSFWALMGWGTLGAPEWAYRALLAFSLICLAGLAWLTLRSVQRRSAAARIGAPPAAGEHAVPGGITQAALPDWLGAVLLALFALAMTPEPLYRAVYYEAPTLLPGRYLFGALGAIGLLLALGWAGAGEGLLALVAAARYGGRTRSRAAAAHPGDARVQALSPTGAVAPEQAGDLSRRLSGSPPRSLRALRRALLAAPGLALAALSIWLLPHTIIPAYAAPAPLPAGTAIPNRVDFVYGGGMHLIGYALTPTSVAPGGVVHITLYWQALRPMVAAYTVGVHVVNDDGKQSYGEVDSYPGRGNLATPLWQPGATYADHYDVLVSAQTLAPQLGKVYVGVQLQQLDPLPNDPLHRRTAEELPVTDSAGKGVTPFLGRFRIGGPPAGLAGSQPRYRFGDDLALLAMQATATGHGTVEVRLRLAALRAPLPRLVVFAHLLRPDGVSTQHGQDAEPLDFRYPTDLWPAGEQVDDTLTITLPAGFPPGSYLVEAGVYDRASGQRLPVTDAAGRAQPQQRVIVGTVNIGG